MKNMNMVLDKNRALLPLRVYLLENRICHFQVKFTALYG